MGIAVCLAAFPAFAFSPDFKAIEDDLVPNRYPDGSIRSRSVAEQAVADVKQARTKLNEISDYSTRRCYSNFFVNSCIDDVRKAKMRQEARLRKVESQAKGFIHEDKHRIELRKQAERDRRAAARHSQEAHPPRAEAPVLKSAPQSLNDQKARERTAQRQARHDEAVARATAEQAAREKKAAEKRARAEQRARRAQQNAAKQNARHAKAVADQQHDRKVREERMKERSRKQAENAKKKSQQAAVKPAIPPKANK
ncbi:MAG TPA: hypothetical protein DEO49_03050 [Sutterella sp.]|nr:hypothetical protein [Sutterella sp.]